MEQNQGLPPRITSRVELARSLEVTLKIVGQGHLSGINGKNLTAEQLTKLREAVQRPTDRSVTERLGQFSDDFPTQDSLTRWLAARVSELRVFKKGELYPAAEILLKRLRPAVNTPLEHVPKPAPVEEILTERMLSEASDTIELSGENSVAARLLNPLALSADGLTVRPHPDPADKSFHFEVDFSLPTQLLEIVAALKHPESEKVLWGWLLAAFRTDSAVALRFLQILTNFTSFLDSRTHTELLKPPQAKVSRPPEILLQPFNCLLHTTVGIRQQLHLDHFGQPVLSSLDKIQTLIRLRYGEVYRGLKQTSLFAASEEALTPSPADFAQLTSLLLEGDSNQSSDLKRVATAVVKLAESLGVTDLEPLLPNLKSQPAVREALMLEAGRVSLLPEYARQSRTLALLDLLDHPWQDAAEMDFSQIIDRGTAAIEVYAYTGTFGPFTKGHKDLVAKLSAYIDSLPPVSREGKKIQRMILIIPMTDISSIDYPKNPADIGPLEARVISTIFQISEFDRHKVFVTTSLQPDPRQVDRTQRRVWVTCNNLFTKIVIDMRRAGVEPSFAPPSVYSAFGPDEFEWVGHPRKLAPRDKQDWKVTEPGGVAIVRRGWLLAMLRNWKGLRDETGIGTVILTPGTPFSSSSEVRKEIALTGATRAVEETVKNWVVDQWSPERIAERRKTPPFPSTLSVGRIYHLWADSTSTQSLLSDGLRDNPDL